MIQTLCKEPRSKGLESFLREPISGIEADNKESVEQEVKIRFRRKEETVSESAVRAGFSSRLDSFRSYLDEK